MGDICRRLGGSTGFAFLFSTCEPFVVSFSLLDRVSNASMTITGTVGPARLGSAVTSNDSKLEAIVVAERSSSGASDKLGKAVMNITYVKGKPFLSKNKLSSDSMVFASEANFVWAMSGEIGSRGTKEYLRLCPSLSTTEESTLRVKHDDSLGAIFYNCSRRSQLEGAGIRLRPAYAPLFGRCLRGTHCRLIMLTRLKSLLLQTSPQ